MTARVWHKARLATLCADAPDGWGTIDDGAIVAENGKIAWLGPGAELPQIWRETESVDCHGAWLLPGLIDCHTHLVHAGNRVNEFEARLNGASYADIARAGGGIAATVRATRAADEAALVEQSEKRLRRLIGEGVTTVEIKSGYGLDAFNEQKMLRVARALGAATQARGAVRIRTTFLGAHTVPAEFAGRQDDYVTEVCEHMLPAAHALGLVDAVDAFCENIAFTPEQTRRVFAAAAQLGLPVKLHADQISNGEGGALAAAAAALSADHLEYASEASVAAMAAAGTVAVLLPGAFFTLRDTQLPPVDAFRHSGVPMAVATDCNPGTSPCTSPLLMLNMASTLFRLTPLEAVAGMTRNAARALGLAGAAGELAVGQAADFTIWDIERPAELVYALGANPLINRVFAGRPDGSI